jgi:hypothetical protein
MAIQFCCVCGRGSNRASWNYQNGALVACDFHSQPEFQWAVQNSTTPAPNIDVVDAGTDVSPQT